jgi:hypothetical protein
MDPLEGYALGRRGQWRGRTPLVYDDRVPVPSHLARALAGLLVAACAAGGCEWIAGIHDPLPVDAGGATDAALDGRLDALAGDAPADAPATDAEALDGPDDGAAGDAAAGDAGPDGPSCGLSTCPNGCCNNSGLCVTPPFPQCGQGGSHCVQCSTDRADTCDNGGACACGSNLPCNGDYYCAGGTCYLCGVEVCANGCCSSLVCVRGAAFPTCGVNGGSCRSCDTTQSDGCLANGDCGCGGAALCGAGFRCAGGGCEAL